MRQGPFDNTYTVTKLITEQMIASQYKHLPICIVRPSIIQASLREPNPGYTDAMSGVTMVALENLRGTTSYFYADGGVTLELVPLDLAANTALVAGWYSIDVDR